MNYNLMQICKKAGNEKLEHAKVTVQFSGNSCLAQMYSFKTSANAYSENYYYTITNNQ